MKLRSAVVVVVLAAACSPTDSAPTRVLPATTRQTLFDCSNPTQRLSCAAPENDKKHFVCHATGSGSNPYVKISVSNNSSHTYGVAHGGGSVADQAPGASAGDVGSGAGLDCECQARICEGVCTGAAAGTACDDSDKCTGDGTCSGDTCVSGAATCAAGVPVDSCNVESGACDSATGECAVEPLPAGTSCDGSLICDGAGLCVECLTPATCPGVDDACQARTCIAGACGISFVSAGTACGSGFVCNGSGACVGVPHVVINEIESSGGVPGDWVELFNSGTAAADLSGWGLLDNDNTHVKYVFPAGTTLAVGGTLVVDEATFVFGLGAADSARLFDASNALVDTYSWTAHAVTTYGRCPNGTGGFTTTTTVTKGTANDCSIAVRINEIESSGGIPGDWVELFNAGPVAVNLSGWVFRDSDDTHTYVLPAGTTIAPGAYYLLEEAAFSFGLGTPDAARLFDASGALIDSFAWGPHAATTYGRCPNGSGAFSITASATKGAANSCGGGGPSASAWPGRNAVVTVDGANVFGQNLSGIFYEPAANVLWAARNGPSTLFRLVWNGTIWTPDTSGGWSAGKTLRYPGGTGSPDAEDVTRAELGSTGIYISTERDNDVSTVSRLSVLRFDTSATGSELVATHEWNLNADLPPVGANLGLEAITWIPDTFLVANGFRNAAGTAYDPAAYPGHGTGLFFVGLEANGTIYAYALDHVGGSYTRVAAIVSGDATTKALYFDRDVGYLWAYCGAPCGNQSSIFAIDTAAASTTVGRFKLIRQVARPSTMPNITNEGIAIAPESQCSGGFKSFWWTDDAATDGHSLRADTIACGAFVP